MKVSVIMPVYNAENYLPRSIASVKEQTYSNWELLIVDDGSTDNSIMICKDAQIDDARIKLICNEHGGTAIARNTAIEVATGEYIAFLDADDAYHPDYLREMVNAVIKNKTDIALCRIIRGQDATKFLQSSCNPVFDKISIEEIYERMYGGEWPDMIAPCTKIYARKIFDKVKFPSGRFFEDAATMNLAIYYSNGVSITETPMYFYNVTPNSSSVTKRSVELQDREWALRSHWEFYFKEGRDDLAYMSLPFYLVELISIYNRVKCSDRPEDAEIIRGRFDDVYKKYHRQIVLSSDQKDIILDFRHPTFYHLRSMVRKDGIIRTLYGFVERKLKKIQNYIQKI